MSNQSDLAKSAAGFNGDPLSIDTANNRVGIGTSLPTSTASAGPTLEISGTAGGNLVLSDSNATTGQRAKYFLSQGGTLYIGHSADNGTSPVNDLVVDSSGKAGIGTTSPSSYYANQLVVDTGSALQSGITIVSDTGNQSMFAFADGTSGDQRYRGFLDYNHSNDVLSFGTAGGERMRITSGGNVGIGCLPATPLDVTKAGGGNFVATFQNTTSATPYGVHIKDAASGANGYPLFQVTNSAGSQAYLRVDSGTGNTTLGSFSASGGSVGVLFDIGGGTSETEIQTSVNGTATRTHYKFINDNGAVGTITTNGSATAFNTSSDYRLKENVTDVTDGITRVKQLEPKRFNFIVDPDTTVDGFLAHEAQAVVPEAVTGTHNEVDDDGNAVMQGIDQSKLVPLLTAALKEAITKIETLEARLDALELP